jgi:hypothetical protein
MLFSLEPDSGCLSTPFDNAAQTRALRLERLRSYSRPVCVSPIVPQELRDSCGDGSGEAAPAPGEFLPCLSRNNSIERPEPLNEFQPGHKKTSWLLHFAVSEMCRVHGIERIGFVTLTFCGGPRRNSFKIWEKASAALNSAMTNVLRAMFPDYICVMERDDQGVIHYHLCVVMERDIRTGFDHEAVKARDYRSASPYLRMIWRQLRERLPAFGFGRAEVVPVKSNAEGISRYIGKYISKHIGNRQPEDKGCRLVRFSRSARVGTTNFAWNSPRAWLWRAKVAAFARKHGCADLDELKGVFGDNWAHHQKHAILAVKLHYWPNRETALLDGQTWLRDFPEDGCAVHADPFRPYLDVSGARSLAAAQAAMAAGLARTEAVPVCAAAAAFLARVLARKRVDDPLPAELLPADLSPEQAARAAWNAAIAAKGAALKVARDSAECPF